MGPFDIRSAILFEAEDFAIKWLVEGGATDLIYYGLSQAASSVSNQLLLA